MLSREGVGLKICPNDQLAVTFQHQNQLLNQLVDLSILLIVHSLALGLL